MKSMIIPISILSMAAGIVLWCLWWWLPKTLALNRQLSNSKDIADLEDSFRQTIGQAMAGVAALISIYFAIMQYSASTRSAQLEQYQKGFAALAGTEVAMHVGAIYGLQALSESVPEWQTPIAAGLTAAAMRFAAAGSGSGSARIAERIPFLAADAQAALYVLGHAKQTESAGIRPSYQLAGSLFRGVNLSGSNFNEANFQRADLSGGDLYRIQLYKANLAFSSLDGSNMASANFAEAKLVGAHLCRAVNVTVLDLQIGTPVSAQLADAKFYNANLDHAFLVAADLRKAVFSDATLNGADLRGSTMDETTDFSHAVLDGADLSYVSAAAVKFDAHRDKEGKPDSEKRTTLKGANMTRADFSKATFVLADLSGAHLDGSNLSGADLTGANTSGVTDVGTHYCNTKWSDGSLRSDSCTSTWVMPQKPKLDCPAGSEAPSD